MRYRRKQSTPEKNKKCNKTKSVLHAEKHRMCTQKIRKSRYAQKIKQSYRKKVDIHKKVDTLSLSRAIFSERQSRILFCNYKKNLQLVVRTAKCAEVEPN